MRAARPDAAAHDSYGELVLLCVRRRHAGVALAERQVHSLGRYRFTPRQIEQLAHDIFSHACFRTGDAEIAAAAADLHVQALLEQVKIFVQRATEIREPRVVGGLEIEFAGTGGVGRCHDVQRPTASRARSLEPTAGATTDCSRPRRL